MVPGGAIRVVSDTHAGKAYRVEFSAYRGGGVVFSCTPEGSKAFQDDHLATTGSAGVVPCMHAAVAARRLEREGLIVLVNGEWVDNGVAPELAADPFATFAGCR